jgi:hypothetical protein
MHVYYQLYGNCSIYAGLGKMGIVSGSMRMKCAVGSEQYAVRNVQ